MFYLLVNGNDFLSAFLFRVLVAQSVAIYHAFEIFPDSHNFLGINGISNFFSIFSGQSYSNAGRLLFEFYSADAMEQGTAGSIVGLFIAESWALFGIFGLIFLPIFVGFFFKLNNIFFLTNNKYPLYVGFYVYLWTKLSIAGSVAQFLYPLILILMFALFFSIILFSGIFKKILRK
jgi:hypothetical protein